MSIGYLKILKFNNIFILSKFPMFIKCVLIKHIYHYFFPTLLVLPTNLPGNHMHIFHFITLFLNCLFEIHQCFLYACGYVAIYWGISNLAEATSPKESGPPSLSRHQQLIDSRKWEELQKSLLQPCWIFFLWKYRSWACHYGCYVLMHATVVSEKEIILWRFPLPLPVRTSIQFSRVCPWAADGGKLVRLRFSFVEHLE